MLEFHFDPLADAPTISAIISSPKGKRKVQLIFDTGAERTQLRRRTMHRLGYSEEVKTRNAKAVGVGGAEEHGYMVRIPQLFFLGSFAENVELAVFDMDYLGNNNIDGLFGWDFVRLFHLEMDGPNGILKVF
jgi:predicted aspartyl protease